MKHYFANLEHSWRTRAEYLIEQPPKREVLKNGNIDGATALLPGSNNRAITIHNGNYIYLQSYDTIILSVNVKSGKLCKYWNDYSVTTMKHINDFLRIFADGQKFNKKEWLAFKTSTLKKGV